MISQIKPLIKKKVKLPINKNLVIFFFINLFLNELIVVLKIYLYDLYLLYKFPQVYPLQ